jgi:putative ATP-dependent endonuclease of OLD family
MLFADKVVLVEGLTEKLLVPIFMHKEGLDIDDNHISVVEMGGKWIKHFLYLFAPQRKTKVLCLTDCDYQWIVSNGINTTPYTTYEAVHVRELKGFEAANPYIKASCQCNADGGTTFEDQLMLDNWTNKVTLRKQLLKLVFPDTLCKFVDDYPLTIPQWYKNLKNLRKDTREKVLQIISPFRDGYLAAFNRKDKNNWTALFFSTLFKEYASSQKGNLALSILTDEKLCKELNTPRYIKEGIEWLKN